MRQIDLEKTIKKRKLFILIFSILLLVIYIVSNFIEIDFFINNELGKNIFFLIGVYLSSFFGITLIETMSVLLTEGTINIEEDIVRRALNSSEGAGYILIAKAIKLLAYSLIVLSVILVLK